MLRYAGLIVLCFASSLLGSGVTLLVAKWEPGDAETGRMEVSTRTLVAHAVVLKDRRGNVRMRLGADEGAGESGSGHLVLYDDRGVPRLRAGVDAAGEAYWTLANGELPNPDHKRILLAVDESTARLEMGHADLTEITLRSARPSDVPANAIRVKARNGSEAVLYTDAYGHATAEVRDATTAPIFRVPEWRPLFPE